MTTPSPSPWTVLWDAIDGHDLSTLRAHLTPSAERSAAAITQALRPTRNDNIWSYAVRHGTAEVLTLLAPFVDVRCGELGNPPIMIGAVAGNPDTVQALLQRWGGDEDLAEVDGQGHDTLQVAVMHGQPAIVGVLLDHLASPYETARAFNLAVHKERWAIVDALASRADLPEHRIASKLNGRLDSEGQPVHLPLWTARREAGELRDAVATVPSEPDPDLKVRPRL